MLALLVGTAALNVYLYSAVPKGFFPLQDTGRLNGIFQGDQSISFQAMRQKINQLMQIVSQDPDIDTYYEYSGGAATSQSNTGSMFARLKPLEERSSTAQEIVDRLRPKLARVPGAQLLLTAQQDLNIGARAGAAQYQYTLFANELPDLQRLAPALRGALSRLPELTDVSSDYQDRGLQTVLEVDRAKAAHLGISAQKVDAVLGDAFGQRLVSTIYEPAEPVLRRPDSRPGVQGRPGRARADLRHARLGEKVPLAAIARWETRNAPLSVNHQGQFAAATISSTWRRVSRSSERPSRSKTPLRSSGRRIRCAASSREPFRCFATRSRASRG